MRNTSVHLRSLLRAILVAACVGTTPLSAQMVFIPEFTGGTLAQQAATAAALRSLAASFRNPIQLRVSVTIEDLMESSTLGSSSIPNWFQIGGAGYYYAPPLYNIVTGTDLAGNVVSIEIKMNSNEAITWSYGVGAPGPEAYSWQSVVMHEALHSMGVYDGVQDASGALDPGYTLFDSFTTQLSMSRPFTANATDAERAAAIVSGDLYWTGPAATSANGGRPIQLYAPATFEEGSTYSHVDPSQTGSAGLIFPSLDAGVYYPGPTAVELGILQDLGYDVGLSLPTLSASFEGGRLHLSWPASASGFVLESTDIRPIPYSWTRVTADPVLSGGTVAVTVGTAAEGKIFRLKKA